MVAWSTGPVIDRNIFLHKIVSKDFQHELKVEQQINDVLMSIGRKTELLWKHKNSPERPRPNSYIIETINHKLIYRKPLVFLI